MTKTFLMTPHSTSADIKQAAENNSDNLSKKQRASKPKKSTIELIKIFWEAPMEAFFNQEIVAPVTSKSLKTLEAERWRGNGIPYRKCSGRVLYRKLDVVQWLEGHELIRNTSELEVSDV